MCLKDTVCFRSQFAEDKNKSRSESFRFNAKLNILKHILEKVGLDYALTPTGALICTSNNGVNCAVPPGVLFEKNTV